MTNTITRTLVSPTESPTCFSTDASLLGLAPGRWPEAIQTDMGNSRPVLLARVNRTADGEVYSAHYEQPASGLRITVWNT